MTQNNTGLFLKWDTKKIEQEINNMIGGNVAKFQRACLTDIQEILLRFIKQLAPRNTGAYADSWRAEAIKGNKAVISSKAGKLFVILEFRGAKPGIREPRTAQALRFEIDGKVIFALRVNFPGFDAIPHVRPALKKLNADAKVIVAAHLSKLSAIFLQESNKAKPKIANLKKIKLTRNARSKAGSRLNKKKGSL